MTSIRIVESTPKTKLSIISSVPENPDAVALVLPAMGVPAKLYTDFAEKMAANGIAALVMDLRGQGGSVPKSSRNANWTHSDLVDIDVPAALEFAAKECPDLPIFLIGHSLGGHLALMRASRAPEGLAGVVLIASGSVWFRTFDGVQQQVKSLLGAQLFALVARTLGYFPGERMGFGGRQATGVMTTWARQVRQGIMTDDGNTSGNGIFECDLPLLAVRVEGDTLATEAGVRRLVDAVPHAPQADWTYTAAEAGGRLDHFRWAKHSGALATRLKSWMDTVVADTQEVSRSEGES
ncbi:alpha/beta fold hydrolase [Nocardia sp. NPDC059177]|uniref:alpha/beta hydrolase family protein n=1 Tax=Nocardia sp. NPDC059177 TaxID=3346759 RepID=UPI00369562A0